jgi:pimeloyl-ACP methyl ester carboxylesterase
MAPLRSLRNSYRRLPLLWKVPIRTIVNGALIVVFLVITQSIQIFPGALLSRLPFAADSRVQPADIESTILTTRDGESIETWRLEAPNSSLVAIIFHGNAGDVQNFQAYQRYFRSIGITSYGFDYRGFGESSGWPSEEGLYIDSDTVVQFVLKREGIARESLILAGVSIGSGPAAYAAATYNPGALILFSPFESLTELVRATPVLGYLHPFLFYEFPVRNYVTRLKSSCLIVAHGKQDEVIPIAQARNVFQAYRGDSHSALLVSDVAMHNDILFKIHQELTPELKKCSIPLLATWLDDEFYGFN